MPWYFRRSRKAGPLRFTVSKSGLGVSAGVRGARVTVGPRGSYITIGRGGPYYRERLDGLSRRSPQTRVPVAAEPAQPVQPELLGAEATEDLVESSADETLASVNQRLARHRLAPWVGWLGALLLLASLLAGAVGVVVACVWLAVFIWSRRFDRERRAAQLHYELDSAAGDQFEVLQHGVSGLSSAQKVWQVLNDEHTDDWKRNAGATGLVRRKHVGITTSAPQLIVDVPVLTLRLQSTSICFLPDRLLIYRSGRYGAVPYPNLRVDSRVSNFREDERVPSDARVVGSTWRYVRRDGGPDRRFSGNRQIPIAAYSEVDLSTEAGLIARLHISSTEHAMHFVAALQAMRSGPVPPAQPFNEVTIGTVVVGPKGIGRAQQTSFNCPTCNTINKVTYGDVLEGKSITCPGCGVQSDLVARFA